MIIGAVKEKHKFENRVAISPEEAKNYVKSGHQVLIEKSAGLASGFTDASYKEAGANISSAKEILKKSQILVKIQLTSNEEIKEMQANSILISQVNVNSSADLIKSLNAKKYRQLRFVNGPENGLETKLQRKNREKDHTKRAKR